MKTSLRYLLLLPVMTVLIAFAACSGRHDYITKVGMVWNTTYHITYKGPESLQDSIIATLQQVSASVNVFDSLSTLARINRGETNEADSVLIKIVTGAKSILDVTEGARYAHGGLAKDIRLQPIPQTLIRCAGLSVLKNGDWMAIKLCGMTREYSSIFQV